MGCHFFYQCVIKKKKKTAVLNIFFPYLVYHVLLLESGLPLQYQTNKRVK